jgi:molybdopterin molybdotransferase
MHVMKSANNKSIDLEIAQSLILDECAVLEEENLSLAFCLNRFPANALVALESLPGYDQSLRDGYAVSTHEPDQGKANCFRVVDEVAAGDTRHLVLSPGEAIRIMTGGLIPAHTTAVAPSELCTVVGETVEISGHFFEEKKRFIHGKGTELTKGQVIAPEGAAIRAEQQILLAGVGYNSVPVVRKPRVSFFCTGSELVSGTEEKLAGMKFSANNYLLQGLIHLAGAELQTQKTVMDDPEAVARIFTAMKQSGSDIIISTGGMGPGKFDLVEEAFQRTGGRVIYRSLRLRPGKATLFGLLGRTLFFGMPGPPPAVHLLFNELIRPAILALQGAKSCLPRKIQACLTEDLHLPGRGLPRLKSGMLSFAEGECLVRPSNRVEASNCYIYCSEAGTEFRRGEKVTVHLTGSSLPGLG